MNQPGLSIFFPAFNEESAIAKTVAAAILTAGKLFNDFEVLVVDDGSTDRTPAIIDRLARENPKIRAIHHPANRGYGAAIKSGLAHSTKELIFYADGDNQFDLAEISLLLPQLVEADLVIGYRLKRRDSWLRRLFGWAWGVLIGLLFGLWVRDIDCAFKLMKRAVVKDLDLKSEGAVLSAELLIKAKKRGWKIKEVGVHHYPRQGGQATGARPRVVLKAFYELLKFRRELS